MRIKNKNMIKLINLTTTEISQQSIYDDNKDIIWPTIIGIFVALALGWMICRYKCSSEDRSPHSVRCCPKSLCQRIRLCCTSIFRFKNESQHSGSRRVMNKGRSSTHSILEIPPIINNSRSSVALLNQQWPPSFLLNNKPRPSSITIPPTIKSSQPKRHPLRRESTLTITGNNDERRDSSPWPFQTKNMIFHEQTNEIKKSFLFFKT